MVPFIFLGAFACVLSGGGPADSTVGTGADSAAGATRALPARLNGTSWSCDYVGVLPQSGGIGRIAHSWSFTATTATTDLPERLADSFDAGDAARVLDTAGFLEGVDSTRVAAVVIDAAPWVPIGNDSLLVDSVQVDGVDNYAGFVFRADVSADYLGLTWGNGASAIDCVPAT